MTTRWVVTVLHGSRVHVPAAAQSALMVAEALANEWTDLRQSGWRICMRGGVSMNECQVSKHAVAIRRVVMTIRTKTHPILFT